MRDALGTGDDTPEAEAGWLILAELTWNIQIAAKSVYALARGFSAVK